MEFPHDARYPPAVPVQRRLNLGLCMGNSQYIMALCLASWRAFRIRAPDWVQPDLQTPPPNAYPNVEHGEDMVLRIVEGKALGVPT